MNDSFIEIGNTIGGSICNGLVWWYVYSKRHENKQTISNFIARLRKRWEGDVTPGGDSKTIENKEMKEVEQKENSVTEV